MFTAAGQATLPEMAGILPLLCRWPWRRHYPAHRPYLCLSPLAATTQCPVGFSLAGPPRGGWPWLFSWPLPARAQLAPGSPEDRTRAWRRRRPRGGAYRRHPGALEQLGIPIDYIAGTSMGAVVGGLYASGMSPQEIENHFKEADWRYLLSNGTPRENECVPEQDARLRARPKRRARALPRSPDPVARRFVRGP